MPHPNSNNGSSGRYYRSCTGGCTVGPYPRRQGIRAPYPSRYQQALCKAIQSPVYLWSNWNSPSQLGSLPPFSYGNAHDNGY